jgi:PilZ domain
MQWRDCAHVRHDVSLAGELFWNGGGERRRCTIRDISLDGARIDTGFFVSVPTEVYLLEEGSGTLFECQVRWQQAEQMGLYFIDTTSASARRALIQQHAKKT